jgi:hypothetical protein
MRAKNGPFNHLKMIRSSLSHFESRKHFGQPDPDWFWEKIKIVFKRKYLNFYIS